MVAKHDGRIRVCVDCTPANKVTRELDWPLPRLQDLRYVIRGARWFSRIDLKDAFFRIRIPQRFRYLTAFRVKGQSYQFKKMPFGLKTAPAVYQRFMDRGLSSLAEIAFWYIDDILITANTPHELRVREARVRRQLSAMKCEINEAKSVAGRSSLLFAGLWVMGWGLGANAEQVKKVLQLAPPNTKTEAQSALGLVSYLRDFIPLVGHFTAMLYPDKQGLKLETNEFHRQWKLLLGHIASALTINNHWKDGTPAQLYTDASQYALGLIILQNQRIVAVASRKLTPAETRYSATDREHLGLVYAAERFKLLLHQSGTIVEVFSDHAALVTRKQDNLTPRQARWQDKVLHWLPTLRHVKGKQNPADYISRWKDVQVGANLAI